MIGVGGVSSIYSSYVNDETDSTSQRILPISDSSKFITRNTNVSLVHKQIGGTCYSHAAASAYINTCARIYGCNPPSFESALEIAKYSGNGGNQCQSLKLMERRFQRGVCWDSRSGVPSIRDIMMTSVIISFGTTKEGYWKIQAGSLLEKPIGKVSGYHACLVESYDFETGCLVLKNSWGKTESTSDRFVTRWNCLHKPTYTHVYFTLNSIKGKGYPYPNFRLSRVFSFPPNGVVFNSGDPTPKLKCAFMDELSANYTTSWWCFPVKNSPYEKEGLTYIGFLVESWIRYSIHNND